MHIHTINQLVEEYFRLFRERAMLGDRLDSFVLCKKPERSLYSCRDGYLVEIDLPEGVAQQAIEEVDHRLRLRMKKIRTELDQLSDVQFDWGE